MIVPHLIEKNRAGTLRACFYDEDGTLTGTGTTSVTVTDGEGTTVDSGTATNTADGTYTFPLAAQDTEATLTVEWVRSGETVTTHAEIVGWFPFTIAQARTWDDSAMTSESLYPAADIRNERARILDDLEDALGWPIVPRWREAIVDGDASSKILLPDPKTRQVLSVEERDLDDGSWTAFTASELTDVALDGPTVTYRTGWFASGTQNYRIRYVAGPDRPLAGTDRISLLLLRDRLVEDSISPRTLSHTDEVGTVRYAVPGRQWPFGIPEVDQWIERHRQIFGGW